MNERNLRPENIELINIEEKFLDIGLVNNFKNMIPKAQTTKVKLSKWDYTSQKTSSQKTK